MHTGFRPKSRAKQFIYKRSQKRNINTKCKHLAKLPQAPSYCGDQDLICFPSGHANSSTGERLYAYQPVAPQTNYYPPDVAVITQDFRKTQSKGAMTESEQSAAFLVEG